MEIYIQEVKTEIDNIKILITISKTLSESEKLALKNKLGELKGRVSNLPSLAQVQLGSHILEIGLLKSKIEKLEKKIEKQGTEIEKLKQENQKQDTKIEKQGTEIEELKQENQKQDTKIEELKQENKDLNNRLMYEKTTLLARQLIYTYVHEIGSQVNLQVWDLGGLKTEEGALRQNVEEILDEASGRILEGHTTSRDLLAFLNEICNDALGDAHPVNYPFTRNLITQQQFQTLIEQHYNGDTRLLNLLNEVAEFRTGKSLLAKY